MNSAQLGMARAVDDLKAQNVLIDEVTKLIAERYAVGTDRGYRGWHTADKGMRLDICRRLERNVGIRDWADVVVLASMLHVLQRLDGVDE